MRKKMAESLDAIFTRRLLCGLGFLLTTAAGFSWAAGEDGIRVEALAETTRSWNGQTLPAYPEGQPEITILRILLPPKARLPLHKHPVINAGVLLQGELTVVTEAGQTLHLKAGQPIVEVVDTWHHGWNPGEGPAEILVFYAGAQGIPVTVQKPQTPGGGGVPEATAPPPRADR